MKLFLIIIWMLPTEMILHEELNILWGQKNVVENILNTYTPQLDLGSQIPIFSVALEVKVQIYNS